MRILDVVLSLMDIALMKVNVLRRLRDLRNWRISFRPYRSEFEVKHFCEGFEADEDFFCDDECCLEFEGHEFEGHDFEVKILGEVNEFEELKDFLETVPVKIYCVGWNNGWFWLEGNLGLNGIGWVAFLSRGKLFSSLLPVPVCLDELLVGLAVSEVETGWWCFRGLQVLYLSISESVL